MSDTPRPQSTSSQTYQKPETDGTDALPRLDNFPANSTGRPSSWRSRSIFALCMILHLLLIAGHLGLVILGHKTKRVLFFKEDTWTVSMYYVAIAAPNTFGKVFSVIALYLTQKLALRRNLLVRQSLTSVHDKSTAWLGLAPAAIISWKQFTFTSAGRAAAKQASGGRKHDYFRVFGVFAVFAYLGGLFGLNEIVPMLLTIGDVPPPDSPFSNITTYVPTVGANITALQNAFPIVSVVSLLDSQIVLYGLQENYVFDVPEFFTGDNPIQVSAVQLNSTCRTLPDLSFSAYDAASGMFTFEIDPTCKPVNLMPTINSLSIASLELVDPSQPAPATMIIASTSPVIDDANFEATPVKFSPEVLPGDCGQNDTCDGISQIQIFACDFYAKDVSLKFDPITITVTSFPADNDYDEAPYWYSWTLPETPPPPALSLVHMFNELSPDSDRKLSYTIAGGQTWTRNLTILEDALMDALGFYEFGSETSPNLPLLELALEQAVASVLWRAAISEITDAPSNKTMTPARISIRIGQFAPIVGLLLSIVLFFLALFLAWQPRAKEELYPGLETPGILQVTYLSAKEVKVPEALNSAVGSQDPYYSTLRAAGKGVDAWSFGLRD